MIYTIDRETPDHDLQKATHEELDRIVELIKKAGIPATNCLLIIKQKAYQQNFSIINDIIRIPSIKIDWRN